MSEEKIKKNSTQAVFRAEHISKSFNGKKIIDDCSISMKKGDVKVIIGPSGAGKSTFLHCLNCLNEPDEGEIWLESTQIDQHNGESLRYLRQHVGMIFQDFNLFEHLSAEDNIALALRKVKGLSKQEAWGRSHKELSRVGLEDKGNLYPAQLSGGQKQRVAIARALALDPTVLLLDEPTSALDPELVGEVLNVIRELAANGMPMIMVTHQMEFARAVATEIIFMEDGKIIEQGTPNELFAGAMESRTHTFYMLLHDINSGGE